MTIIVETGELVADANSFGTIEELRAYGADRGEVISEDDHLVAPHLVIASDYLWQLDGSFKGAKLTETQGMPWPRSDVVLADETEIATDSIPTAIKRAQLELAFRSYLGVDIVPVRSPDTPILKRKKTGPLEKEWFEGSNVLSLPSVDRYLAPYMRVASALQVVRV